jgi:hypothetical protein
MKRPGQLTKTGSPDTWDLTAKTGSGRIDGTINTRWDQTELTGSDWIDGPTRVDGTSSISGTRSVRWDLTG